MKKIHRRASAGAQGEDSLVWTGCLPLKGDVIVRDALSYDITLRAPRCGSGPNCPLEGPPMPHIATGGPFPQATPLPSPSFPFSFPFHPSKSHLGPDPHLSEVSKRGWREGGRRPTAPKIQQKLSPELGSPSHTGGHRKKGAEKKAGIYGMGWISLRQPPLRMCVKWAPFVKLALSLGAVHILGPKWVCFWPFRTTFSMIVAQIVVFIVISLLPPF